MMTRTFFVSLLLVALAACSSDGKQPGAGSHGANGGNGVMGEDGVYSSDLGDITPGTQEELVANIGDRVFFTFNSVTLSANAQNTLRRQAEWLAEHPQLSATVEGHADERGTREYNLALGERRANTVKDYLVGQGVNAQRITTISYGKEHPEYLGSNEAAWSKNRRAVVVVGG